MPAFLLSADFSHSLLLSLPLYLPLFSLCSPARLVLIPGSLTLLPELPFASVPTRSPPFLKLSLGPLTRLSTWLLHRALFPNFHVGLVLVALLFNIN
jgi:hypothetical protein